VGKVDSLFTDDNHWEELEYDIEDHESAKVAEEAPLVEAN